MNTVLMAEQLSGEYRQVFERADLYRTVTGISAEVAEDKMMNLYDIFMTAQSNGKPVDKIIGRDVEKFCKCYFEDYSLRERVKHIPDWLYRICWVVFIFSAIELLEQFETDFEKSLSKGVYYQTDILPYMIGLVTGLLFSAVMGFLVSRLMFRFPKIGAVKFYISIVALFIVFMPVVELWEDNIQTTILIPVIPVIAVCGIYIAAYWGIRAYRRYCHHGSIFKEKLKINRGDSESFLLETGESLVKKFYRKNKRRRRSGKPEWTMWEYMDYLGRQDAKEDRIWRLMAVFYVVLIVVLTIFTLISDGILDALIMAAVLMVIEIPIYFSCKKLSAFGVGCRKKLMQECKTNGMDLIEYVAYLRKKTDEEEKGK